MYIIDVKIYVELDLIKYTLSLFLNIVFMMVLEILVQNNYINS